jgi:V-ATPase subunit C
MQLWLVTIPNNKGSPDKTYSALRDRVEGAGNCRIHRFEMPSLVVGTLDSLMSLSDDLTKINGQVEVCKLFAVISTPTIL